VARSDGLLITGAMAEHAERDGLYIRSKADPDANGFPHFVSAEGWHLYVLADGTRGILASFDPASPVG
jgi:hypothetical protein